jgi:hypothetical protein
MVGSPSDDERGICPNTKNGFVTSAAAPILSPIGLPVVHGLTRQHGDRKSLWRVFCWVRYNTSIDLQDKVIRPRAHIHKYFVQDDWKATRRLTLNAVSVDALSHQEVDNQGGFSTCRRMGELEHPVIGRLTTPRRSQRKLSPNLMHGGHLMDTVSPIR